MRNINAMLHEQVREAEGFLMKLHKDERGDNENLGRMLILALVLIPLVIVITVFGNEIVGKAKTIWAKVIGAPVNP